MGVSIGLTFNSTVRIVTETTQFALPEARIGFFPNVGGTYFLPRLLDNSAYGLFLGLTGKKLSGKEAIQFGLATHYL